jgi:hypothetical protein
MQYTEVETGAQVIPLYPHYVLKGITVSLTLRSLYTGQVIPVSIGHMAEEVSDLLVRITVPIRKRYQILSAHLVTTGNLKSGGRMWMESLKFR